MDENDGRDLSGLNLHGQMAAATRCVRRLFPALIGSDFYPLWLLFGQVALRDCDEAIGMAESFCAGETGAVSQARRVASKIAPLSLLEARDSDHRVLSTHDRGSPPPDSLLKQINEVKGKLRPFPGATFLPSAVSAIARLAWATERAFAAITRSPLSQLDCDDIASRAASAVTDAHKAVLACKHPYWGRFDVEFFSAFRRDVDALRTSHSGEVVRRGIPVDTSDNGELGLLWGNGLGARRMQRAYEWRDRFHSLSTKSARAYLERTEATVPDVVCWYLSRAEDSEPGKLKKEIGRIVAMDPKRAPPVLVFYGPNIDATLREELVTMGAVICTQFRPDLEPSNDETLAIAVAETLKQTYSGWSTDGQGFWTCTDPRVTWRHIAPRGSGEPMAAIDPAPRSQDGATLPKEKLSAEDYLSALKYLESDAGWEE